MPGPVQQHAKIFKCFKNVFKAAFHLLESNVVTKLGHTYFKLNETIFGQFCHLDVTEKEDNLPFFLLQEAWVE